jgi:adenosylcobyric acid synthase
MSALMVQGVSSWAGKSLVTTALVRFFARRGIRVAPFKGQNMSNNARVVDDGEIGVAQYLQALAAGISPDVRMNPVLVKPEGERQSQVVVNGRPDRELSERSWRGRGPDLWPPIEAALRSLLAEYDLVVIEGAGSPAEINLRSTDLANMRVATAAAAPVLLVADIDRGGAFAHLYGTWSLVRENERSAIRGFVLNKFRGDASLLPPAPEQLERLTGVPVVGVLPWLSHGLPDEDGAAQQPASGSRPAVAIVRYPTASNLDEFCPLEQVADVAFATLPAQLENAALVVLPGSKNVAADLDWLRVRGLATAIVARARAGGRVLGICGGLQMLGKRLDEAAGLGLLPVATTYAAEKLTRRSDQTFAILPEPWKELSGRTFAGYEIRHGETRATAPVREALPAGLGFADRAVLGIAVHGLFEAPELVAALVGAAPAVSLELVFDRLADAVERHLDTTAVLALAGVA